MIKIEKIVPGGQTIATLPDGKKAFFWGALPGEIVSDYKVTKTKSRYLEAIASNVKEVSSHRVIPKDECFLSTSPWQIMDYQYELETKQLLVSEVFNEHHISIPSPQIVTDGKDYYYRNKMEYSLYWDNEESIIKLAFHQRGSHCKIPILSSSIERPEIFQKATQIIDSLNRNQEEARKYQSLVLRCSQNGIVSGGLYENNKPHQVFPNLTDEVMGREYSYSPNGFFQINLPVYEMALSEIKNHISTEEVIDLYAGVGSIGLSVAPNARLTLVEVDKYAYSEMVKNIFASSNEGPDKSINEADNLYQTPTAVQTDSSRQTSRTCVQNGNIFAILDKSENVTDYLNSNQTVILDPPRSGCDQKLLTKLLETHPAKIIYLSCNPATQARDVKILLSKYNIDTIKSYNFFPRTPHIENLVVMSSKNN